MTGSPVQSLCLGITGTVALIVALERTVAYHERPEPARAYLVTSLTALGVALLVNVGPVGQPLDQHILRVANASVLISQLLAAIAAWAAVEMVATSAGRPRSSSRLARGAALLAASTALVAAFAHAGARPQASVVHLFADTSHLSDWRPYWVVFGAIAFAPSVVVALLAARHARMAATWLRAGLYCVAIGVTLNATFGALLVISLWVPSGTRIALLQMSVVAVGDLCVGLGCALPHLPEARSRRAIRPVWASLTALYPEVRVGHRPDLRRVVTEVQDCLAVARSRDEVASPMIRAVDRLPQRPADHFDDTVADLVAVAHQRLSSVWDDEPSGVVVAKVADR